jgi:hypothetical protein
MVDEEIVSGSIASLKVMLIEVFTATSVSPATGEVLTIVGAVVSEGSTLLLPPPPQESRKRVENTDRAIHHQSLWALFFIADLLSKSRNILAQILNEQAKYRQLHPD